MTWAHTYKARLITHASDTRQQRLRKGNRHGPQGPQKLGTPELLLIFCFCYFPAMRLWVHKLSSKSFSVLICSPSRLYNSDSIHLGSNLSSATNLPVISTKSLICLTLLIFMRGNNCTHLIRLLWELSQHAYIHTHRSISGSGRSPGGEHGNSL